MPSTKQALVAISFPLHSTHASPARLTSCNKISTFRPAILFNVVWEEETVLPLWPQREGPALSSVGGIVSSPHYIKEERREG